MRARHDRTARRAERAFVRVQAGNDPIDVGNIVIAEAIHVGLAGLSLCLRGTALRQRRRGNREYKRDESNSKHIWHDPLDFPRYQSPGGGIHLTGHIPYQEHDHEKSMVPVPAHAILARLCTSRRTMARTGSRFSMSSFARIRSAF